MKPAGPERDKLIVEIRGEGDRIKCTDKLPKCMGRVAIKQCSCREPKHTPYSTDIPVAMELWEEMKAAGFEIELTTNDCGYSECHMHHPGTGEQFHLSGGTVNPEADAISGAYLKWQGKG